MTRMVDSPSYQPTGAGFVDPLCGPPDESCQDLVRVLPQPGAALKAGLGVRDADGTGNLPHGPEVRVRDIEYQPFLGGLGVVERLLHRIHGSAGHAAP